MKNEKGTNIYKYGKGKPLYVVNGGPGLEYSYLKEFFMPLTHDREIIFYDQWGTGKDFNMDIQVTAADLTQQLVELLKKDTRHKDVVAHSWGTYLAISAIVDRSINSNIDKIILINPFALNYKRYGLSGQRLLSRFPQNILEKIGTLAEQNTKDSYLSMMNIIAPYYTHLADASYPFEFESYNSPMEDGAYGSISGFNLIPMLSDIQGQIYVIKCDDDFISMEDTVELQNIAKKYVVITECGHFPFVEQREKCYQSLVDFLTD